MPKKKQTKRLFSHHRHTGRVLPKHHTSYPLVALLLLMVGVLLGHITLQARAADVFVTAAANGPLPLTPAVILNPQEGQRFTDFPVAVSGTCPSPYFVKLYRNDVFSGSTQCNPDNTFLLYTDLFVGENRLEARIFNAADQEGPRSPAVTVFYDPPTPPAPPPGNGGGTPTPAPSGESPGPAIETEKPFFITTETYFKAIFVGQEIKWGFGIVGGDPPFHITVAWGDGATTVVSNVDERNFTVAHTYTKGPESREYFPVAISVTDTKNRKATLQVFSILNDRIVPGTGSGEEQDGGLGDGKPFISNEFLRRILVAWPAYGVTVLMAASFWLGEQHTALIWLHRPGKLPRPKLHRHRHRRV